MQYLFLNHPHCTCKLDIGSGMVYCDNKKCPRGAWFYYECVDVQEDELTEEKWYCSEECKKGIVRKPKNNKNAKDLIRPQTRVPAIPVKAPRAELQVAKTNKNKNPRMGAFSGGVDIFWGYTQ